MLYHPKKIDYTSPASAQGGPGTQKQITHYFGTPYVDMTLAQFRAVSAAIGASLGDIWWLGGGASANGGNAFMFVKNTTAGALTLGQLVTPALPSTTTVGAAPAPTTAQFITVGLDTTLLGANSEVDNWVFVRSAAATLPQLRRIKANDSSATATLTVALRDALRPNSPLDQDVFDNVPVAAEAVAVIRPHHIIVNTATTTPVGVTLGAVTAGNYTIVQVAGLACVNFKGDGGVNPVVPNQPAVGIAAGQALTLAAATANLYRGTASIIPQIASTDATRILPAYVNFLGQ